MSLKNLAPFIGNDRAIKVLSLSDKVTDPNEMALLLCLPVSDCKRWMELIKKLELVKNKKLVQEAESLVLSYVSRELKKRK